jgi:hypothetical protein
VQLLLKLTRLFKEFMSSRTFPENWFVLLLFQYRTLNKFIAMLSSILQRTIRVFNPSSDMEQWSAFFQLCIAFITSKALALESLSESKLQLIRDTYVHFTLYQSPDM